MFTSNDRQKYSAYVGNHEAYDHFRYPSSIYDSGGYSNSHNNWRSASNITPYLDNSPIEFTNCRTSAPYLNPDFRTNYDMSHLAKRIAQGTFGEIWSVTDKKTAKTYAVKRIKNYESLTYERKRREGLNLLCEGKILMKLNKIQKAGNNGIVKCYKCEYDDEEDGFGSYLVMELCGYNLLQYIQYVRSSQKEITLTTIRRIARQIFNAMKFIHSSAALIHADLKPENISITLDDCGDIEPNMSPHIKIIDFGNAIYSNQNIIHYEIQTLPYRAPEVLFENSDDVTSQIDMWSIGCILCELYAINLNDEYTFKRLFSCYNSIELKHKIANQLSSFPVYLYNELSQSQSQSHANNLFLYGSPVNADETSYIKSKEYRMFKLLEKFTAGSNILTSPTTTNEYQSELICFIDLISCLLDLNPATRYTANHAMKHEFVNKQTRSDRLRTDQDDIRQMQINEQIIKYCTKKWLNGQ